MAIIRVAFAFLLLLCMYSLFVVNTTFVNAYRFLFRSDASILKRAVMFASGSYLFMNNFRQILDHTSEVALQSLMILILVLFDEPLIYI